MINNEIKWINISSTPELKPNGDVLWHGLMNDITNQKLSKIGKNETNEKFKTIIETSPDGIAISSVEGIIEFVTYNTVKMWGYDSEDEIIGKSIFGFIHDSSHDKAKYFIKEMLNGNLTGTTEYLMLRKDGSTFYTETNANILKDENDNSKGILYLNRDITERKKAELDLKNTHLKLEVLMHAIPDLLFEVDSIGTVYNYYTHSTELLAATPDEFLGKTFFDILPPNVVNVCQVAINEAKEKGISTGLQYALKLPHGEFWFGLSVTHIKNSSEPVDRYVFLSRDITVQKKYELELEKLNRIHAITNQMNNLIIRAKNRLELFNEVCKIACKFGGFRMSWISLINKETNSITPLSWCGHVDGYLAAIQQISSINNLSGTGPTGLSAREGKAFVCNNIATNPIMEPWREEALKRGYFSTIALPIKVRNITIGTFNLYANEIDFFTNSNEIDLLESITENMSFLLNKLLDEEEYLIAEEKVKEKEKEFRKLSSNVSDLIFQFTRRLDGSYFVPIASEGIINIFGCTPEDVLTDFTPIANVIHPEDLACVLNEIEFSAAHLTNFTCEFRAQIPSKPIQWIYSKSTPERLPDGSVTWYGFNTDITERIIAEEKIKQSEAFLKETQRIANIGNYVSNLVTCELACSDEVLNIVGISNNSNILDSWTLIVQPIWTESLHSNKTFENISNNRFESEYKIIRQNGQTERWIQNLGEIVFNEQNVPVKLIGTIKDITLRKQAEIEMQKSEAKFKNAFQTGLDAFFIVTLNDGIIIDANLEFENVFGYKIEEVIGKTSNEIGVFNSTNGKISFAELLVKNGFIKDFELHAKKKNGDSITISVSCSIYTIDNNKYVLGVVRDITEKKRIEKEVEMNLSTIRKLSQAIAQSPASIVITDLDGNMVFVNSKFTEVTGYSESEALGKNPNILSTGFTPKLVLKEMNKTMLEVNSWQGVFKNKRKNGEIYWERAVLSPVKDENGVVTNFLGFMEDITEQKNADEAFKKNARELQDYKYAIDETAIVSITDSFGFITYANYNFCNVSKFSIDEIIGKTHRVINSDFHNNAYFENMWNLISNGKVWIGETCNKAKDGTIYWVHGTIIPFLDENNIPFQYLSIRFDITELKKAEAAILQSNERYNIVAKATNDSIWDLNILSQQITRSGNGFEVLFGYKNLNDVINLPNFSKLIHPDDLERVMASKTKVFNNPNELNWEQDYRFLKANGQYAYVRDKGFVIRDKIGKAIRMIGATQDVTDRVEYINAIEEQNTQLRDIAWLQSHVVRAPLSRMMGIVSFLNDVELNSEEFKEWVGHFVNSSAELDKVIKDISNKSNEFDLKFKR